MARVLVFQHVAAEPLGTLDPMLRARGHRIRYVNFNRDPGAVPDMDKYQGLIVLGGPMMPDRADLYPHLATEMRCIEQALAQGKPVLGICLGAQLLAKTLGAAVQPSAEWEIGWYDLHPDSAAREDPLFRHLVEPQPVFQWHGYSFELPAGATRLASSAATPTQAFRYSNNVYGFQFHLELDQRLIDRWLGLPEYIAELLASGVPTTAAEIHGQTSRLIHQSALLSDKIFNAFLNQLGGRGTREVLPSR
jgi:GMP synthase (glutamine-hydrolysing)